MKILRIINAFNPLFLRKENEKLRKKIEVLELVLDCRERSDWSCLLAIFNAS